MRVSTLAQINKTKEIKKCLKAAFDEQLDCVFTSYRKIRKNAPDKANLVYELRAITSNDNLTKYRLEINIYSKTDVDEVDDIADVVEEMLDFAESILPSGNVIKIYKSAQREFIDDPEKDIIRVRINFELNLYERNEL